MLGAGGGRGPQNRPEDRCRRNGSRSFWLGLNCCSPNAPRADYDVQLAAAIQKGDHVACERILRRLQNPSGSNQGLILSVKRRHLKPNFDCWMDRNSDPFLHFYQECSPVIWALDCQQWQLLPLLARYGFDPNRPLLCRRWTYLCSPSARATATPFKKFWTRGKYTYQSALDYYFASIYEFLGEDMLCINGGENVTSPLTYYLAQLPTLLERDVNVHRIDSVIIFNCLAYSFDWYLCRYTNENATVPDITEADESGFAELAAVRTLIQHGFSQFECLEFLSPCYNWYGILLSLLCHPKIDSYGDNTLPPIIHQAGLLLINFLSLRCTFPSLDDFKENLENLQLRKLYSKRYTERRQEFNARLRFLQNACVSFNEQPLSLKLIARNRVRKLLGGVRFRQKVASLKMPAELAQFVMYVEVSHLKSCEFPAPLTALAAGDSIFSYTSLFRDSQC